MKMVESVSGTLGAATRQISRFRGSRDTESGSTSPKKRNSRALGSWRTKYAAQGYVWPGECWPWLIGIMRTERSRATGAYACSAGSLSDGQRTDCIGRFEEDVR